MTGPAAAVQAFIRAWNEPDPGRRRADLEVAVVDEIDFADEAGSTSGRALLSERIGDVLDAMPSRTLEFTRWRQTMGGERGFEWRLRDGRRVVATGKAEFAVAQSGQLTVVRSVVDDAALIERGWLQSFKAWGRANPIALAGAAALLIYIVLWVQSEHFYSAFNVTPEDAGFGSVEIVVRQASHVLATFVEVGLLVTGSLVSLTAPSIYLHSVRQHVHEPKKKTEIVVTWILSLLATCLLLAGLGGGVSALALLLLGTLLELALLQAPRRRYPNAVTALESIRSRLRVSATNFVVFGTLAIGGGYFAVHGYSEAEFDALAVKDGAWLVHTNYPWQARPVSVHWLAKFHPLQIPVCRYLAYLGRAGEVVLIYDRQTDRTLRLASSEVQLTFPTVPECEHERAGAAPASNRF